MAEDKTTFLSRVRIQGDEIFADSREYLNRLYGNVGSVFTPASPYGQILKVVSNIGMLILLYLEDVAVSNNFITATNIEDIYGIAQLAGHDPYRGVAAKGEVKFKFKPGKESSFEGPHVTVNDGTLLRCLNNNLPYTMKFSTGEVRVKKGEVDFTNATIIQGEYKSQKLQGAGTSMQTFNVNIPSIVDHDDIKVFVNGKLWKKYNSIYDMAGRGTEGVLIRTGLSGGIDLIFGNGYFGRAPEFGAIIEVQYLENAGSGGIIDTGSSSVTFRFESPGFDFRGNEVDLNEAFIIQCNTPPRL